MHQHPLHNTKICVVGLGYIGLPTAAILATKGYEVLGCDTDPEVVNTINSGRIHIVEPNLDILVRAAVGSSQLKATTVHAKADVFIVCVPTPLKDGDKPDLSYVHSAIDSLLDVIEPGNLLILESTVPVGTTALIAKRIEEKSDLRVGHDVFLAHCPERVLPGQILKEVIENDRVIGGISPSCTRRALAFYRSFVQGSCVGTDTSTAEMTKLVENSYRDVNIAFANELSMICHKFQINVWDVIRFANRHPRVNILNPGPGVGGHCIAVDPWFIVAGAPDESRLIRAARQVNDSKPAFILQRARELVKDHGLPIGILGLTFKPNVDDFRESPSLHIAQCLTQELGQDAVICHDPYFSSAGDALEGITMVHKLPEFLKSSRSLLLLVDHAEYKDITLRRDQTLYNSRGVTPQKEQPPIGRHTKEPALQPSLQPGL